MHEFGGKLYALGKLSSSSEALQLNLLLHYGHRMHLSWTLRLSTISAILASLCILSSATPTSFTITKDGANHEVSAKAVPGPLRNLPALPQTQSISNRGLSYGSWGNGCTYFRSSSFLFWTRSRASRQFLENVYSVYMFQGLTHTLSERQC